MAQIDEPSTVQKPIYGSSPILPSMSSAHGVRVDTPLLSPYDKPAHGQMEEPSSSKTNYIGPDFKEQALTSTPNHGKDGAGRTTFHIRAQNGNGSSDYPEPESNNQRKRPANDKLDEDVDGRHCKRQRLGNDQY